ncbi:DUF721 domain-containing protein [Streptomyces sp. NPDC055254]
MLVDGRRALGRRRPAAGACLDAPGAGASLCERWAAIAPDLAGHVIAVGFDPESGRLTMCPASSAWATKARLEQARVIAAANVATGRTVVRALRILPPRTAPAPGRADAAPTSSRRPPFRCSDGPRRRAHQYPCLYLIPSLRASLHPHPYGSGPTVNEG